MSNSWHRYLSSYGETEARLAADLTLNDFETVLVIPAFDEAEDFLDTVLPAGASDVLVVVVVNAPDNAAADAVKRSRSLLKAIGGSARAAVGLAPYAAARNVHLLTVNRAGAERLIDRRRGVGLARKIGADCALALIGQRKIHRPWIYATDADVRLPARYFTAKMPAIGSVLFPFRHQAANAPLAQHAALYELHLRYYVKGLRSAGSPYAFHTLGSTMAVHADAYASVRGYPKRNAGEDFYMLNKLAKVAPVHCVSAPEITIAARASTRVPFGTGPALLRMSSQSAAFTSYALPSFDALSSLQATFARMVRGGPWRPEPHVAEVLLELDPGNVLEGLRHRHDDPTTLCKALHQWFDGFRTLRFVHGCRRFHPDAPLLESVARLLGEHETGNVRAASRYLDRLRAEETAPIMGVDPLATRVRESLQPLVSGHRRATITGHTGTVH